MIFGRATASAAISARTTTVPLMMLRRVRMTPFPRAAPKRSSRRTAAACIASWFKAVFFEGSVREPPTEQNRLPGGRRTRSAPEQPAVNARVQGLAAPVSANA